MLKKALKMHDKDNVATVLDDIKKGEEVSITFDGISQNIIVANQDIDCYHKVSIKDTKCNEEVIKYGEIIGKASKAINIGDHVHINNIESVMTK